MGGPFHFAPAAAHKLHPCPDAVHFALSVGGVRGSIKPAQAALVHCHPGHGEDAGREHLRIEGEQMRQAEAGNREAGVEGEDDAAHQTDFALLLHGHIFAR